MDIVIKVTDSGLTGLTFERPSLVKKQFADECDLGKIVQRFVRTGELPNVHVKQPLPFQDISAAPQDFQAAMEFKVMASNMFEAEPQQIKDIFQGSVERYMEFKALPEEQQELFITKALQPASESQSAGGTKQAPAENVPGETAEKQPLSAE